MCGVNRKRKPWNKIARLANWYNSFNDTITVIDEIKEIQGA